MNESLGRDYSLSVRLSLEEKAQLEQLAACLGLDKSAAVRQAVARSLAALKPLPKQGYFRALGRRNAGLKLRLRHRPGDES